MPFSMTKRGMSFATSESLGTWYKIKLVLPQRTIVTTMFPEVSRGYSSDSISELTLAQVQPGNNAQNANKLVWTTPFKSPHKYDVEKRRLNKPIGSRSWRTGVSTALSKKMYQEKKPHAMVFMEPDATALK